MSNRPDISPGCTLSGLILLGIAYWFTWAVWDAGVKHAW